MSTTDRQLQQRRDALLVGNHVRTVRAELRRELKAASFEEGCERVALILDDIPIEFERMKLDDLLLSIRKMGTHRLGCMLRLAGISPFRSLGGLTTRQKIALAEELTQGRYGAGL